MSARWLRGLLLCGVCGDEKFVSVNPLNFGMKNLQTNL